MKYLLVLAVCLTSTSLLPAQETLYERIAKMEANNAAIQSQVAAIAKVQDGQGEQLAAITAMLTRQRADNQVMADRVADLSAKLDALAKSSRVTLVSQPSTTWAGPPTFAAKSQDAAPTDTGWSTSYTVGTRARVFGGLLNLRGRGLLRSGGCQGGSCQ